MASTILTPVQGHYSIAFACIAYLANCMTDLLEQKQDPIAALVSIAEGFHSLQPYANSFWADHFLEFMALSAGMPTLETVPILTELRHLHALCDRSPSLPPAAQETLGNDQLDPSIRTNALAQWEDTRTFLTDMLVHRHNLSRTQEKQPSKCLSVRCRSP